MDTMKHLLFSLGMTLAMLGAGHAHAQSVTITTVPQEPRAGERFTATVILNDIPAINAVEGILAAEGATIIELTTGGSDFPLSPETPRISPDGSTARFILGVPGGVSGSGKKIITAVLTSPAPGVAGIGADIGVYLNDGAGTRVALPIGKATALISDRPSAAETDSWSVLLEEDGRKPAPFSVTVRRDPSMFGGRRYAIFGTTDSGSGIDRYVVIEKGLDPVEASSPYVLVNQDDDSDVTVIAYDKAGNARTSGSRALWWVIVGGVLAAVLAFIAIRRMRR
jgi:hypothetical protein